MKNFFKTLLVSEKDHEIACLRQENKSLRKRIYLLTSSKRDDEIRIQQAKQALFGLPDSNVRGGP